MRKTIHFRTAFILGTLCLLGSAPDSFADPPASGQFATVIDIKGRNDVLASHAGGKKRLSVGDQVPMPAVIETGRNARVLFKFPNEKVAVGEKTKCTLEFPGGAKEIRGVVASETEEGSTGATLSAAELEALSRGTMTMLYGSREGGGNSKTLLVHGEASFNSKKDGTERELEPGQMVVVPENGGEPYCVHIDLETTVQTSQLIQDFKGHWNMEKIEEAIDSQRGRFIQGLPFGLRRGDGPEERRLLSQPKKGSSHGH